MSTGADIPLSQWWVYLSTSPLLGLTLTLWVYALCHALYLRSGQHPLANPVALSVLVLALALQGLDVPYAQYFEGAQFVHFLLGPATVALALPLWEQRQFLRKKAWAVLAGVVAGGTVATGSALALAYLMGASAQTLASLAPKSVTTPVAMAITERIGGLPGLTAALVVSTGIVGAVLGPWMLRHTLKRSPEAVGVALGSVAHGIGTARALQLGRACGAYAALSMALSAVLTSFLLPLVYQR
jgi:predicted murein hydrolase (TIGR00659 family)